MNKVSKNMIKQLILKRSIFLLVTMIIFIGLLWNREKNVIILTLCFLTPILVFQIIMTFFFPILEWNNSNYLIDEKKITINKGVIFRSHIIIPFLQIQDMGSLAGPINMLFKTKQLQISTAGSNRRIDFLDKEICEEIIADLLPKVHNRLRMIDNDDTLF